MDLLLLVVLLSGMCIFSALGMSLFILAASIQSSRISRMERLRENHAVLSPASPEPLASHLSDSLGV